MIFSRTAACSYYFSNNLQWTQQNPPDFYPLWPDQVPQHQRPHPVELRQLPRQPRVSPWDVQVVLLIGWMYLILCSDWLNVSHTVFWLVECISYCVLIGEWVSYCVLVGEWILFCVLIGWMYPIVCSDWLNVSHTVSWLVECISYCVLIG